MENFLFTISKREIRGLEDRFAQPLIDNNPNSFKIGGLLILAVRPDENDPSIFTEFKVFMVFWDVSSGIAKLVIPGVIDNERTLVENPRERFEDTLIQRLLSSQPTDSNAILAPSPRINTINPRNNSNTTVNRQPDEWFKLAFVDKTIYDEMLTNNYFYYESQRIHYRDSAHSIPIIQANRGLSFYAAMSTIYHGIVPPPPPDPGSFTTIMVRPDPEPIIVDDNPNGSVAYVLIPSCPPYWKPSLQAIYSVPGLIFSANRAMQSAEPPEADPQNKPSNLERLIWLLIILILIFIATCKKI